MGGRVKLGDHACTVGVTDAPAIALHCTPLHSIALHQAFSRCRAPAAGRVITVIRGIRSLAEFCLAEFLSLVEIHKSFWRGIEIHTF
jgi:hypothetical protein